MKVNEIRPDEMMDGQASAMQADLDWFAARKTSFVEVPCPACGGSRSERRYEKFGMTHRRCHACGTQFISPRPTSEILAAFYAQSKNYQYWARYIFPRSRENRRRDIFIPRAQMVAEIARQHGLTGGDLVEVGAAHGLFCEEIAKLTLFGRIVAIEPTPELAAECRSLGFHTIEAPWEQVTLDAKAQFIVNFEVIEHLFDPAAFLRWCRDNLQPGGHVLLTCPNIAGFETLLLGDASGAVDHEHLNLFTPESLSALIRANGLDVIACTTPGQLDVELVQRAVKSKELSPEQLGPVLYRLLNHPDPQVGASLQDLIRLAGLSSNMMLLARRPT